MTRDERKQELVTEVSDHTAFAVECGPNYEDLKASFHWGNTDQQRAIKFTVHPYIVDVDNMTTQPFKGNSYILGVAVRQLGYVSADDRVFNVWGYITHTPKGTGQLMYEGSEFRYGTLMQMIYDAVAKKGVVLRLQRKASKYYPGVNRDLAFTPGLCPGVLGDDADADYAMYGMMPLSFPIDFNEFDPVRCIREELDKQFTWDGKKKDQQARSEVEPHVEESVETAEAETTEEPQGDGLEAETADESQTAELVESAETSEATVVTEEPEAVEVSEGSVDDGVQHLFPFGGKNNR